MLKTADRNTKLAYKIIDYIVRCNEREIVLTDKIVVNAIARIIEEFDGRETVELKYTNIHSGFLRGVKGMGG